VFDTHKVRSGRLFRLNVPFEIVQDSLPPAALLFDRMCWLRVKGFAYRDPILPADKFDQQHPAAEGALDQLVLYDLRIDSSEILLVPAQARNRRVSPWAARPRPPSPAARWSDG
jgi:hypothetical protein